MFKNRNFFANVMYKISRESQKQYAGYDRGEWRETKPKEADTNSHSEFKHSLQLVSKAKCHIWILGDFNLPKFDWDDNTPTIKEDCKFTSLYDDFIVMLDDHNLTQMLNKPTRGENVLDLFLTNNPSLVSNVSIIPGIADHDIVSCEPSMRLCSLLLHGHTSSAPACTTLKGLQTFTQDYANGQFIKSFNSSVSSNQINQVTD